MTPGERAERLRLLPPRVEEDLPKPPGGWRYRWLAGVELQVRNKSTCTLRIDVTRSEANDLLTALAMALNETPPPVVRVGFFRRFWDAMARRTWRRKNEVELANARREMIKEFSEGGGW